MPLGRRKQAVNQEFLDECVVSKREPDYRLFDGYYKGEQGTLLRDRTRRFLEVSGKPFAENFCDVTVDVVAERLKVTGFDTSQAVEDQVSGEKNDPLGDQLGEWWQRGRLDLVQQRAHYGAVKLGDYFVIVDWDAEKSLPRFVPQHPCHAKIEYSPDDPDLAEYACKHWHSTVDGARVQRLNAYWPDRVEKWYRLAEGDVASGGWDHFSGDGAWSQPWVTSDGEPLGVPVFHFRYKPGDNTYGTSRLADVLPFQDELNKLVIDLNELCDNHGLPQRWATGITGDVTFKNVAGNVWTATSETAKFGQFDLAPTAELLNAVEGLLSRLARKTRTPMHLLTGGTPPSGESLKTAESGLVSVVMAAQTGFGNTWEDAFRFALRLGADDGAVNVPEDLWLDCQWESPETRSDEQNLAAAEAKHRLGVSKATLLREIGYDPGREAGLRQGEMEAEQAVAEKAFNAGGFA